MSILNIIQRIKEDEKLTNKDLAKLWNVRPDYVSRMLTGSASITIDRLQSLADHYSYLILAYKQE